MSEPFIDDLLVELHKLDPSLLWAITNVEVKRVLRISWFGNALHGSEWIMLPNVSEQEQIARVCVFIGTLLHN